MLALLEVFLCNQPLVEFLVASVTKGDEIAGSIAAHLSALQMVDVEPDLFLFGWVSSTALTSVVVSPKHVLPYIVVTIHLALLVILTLRNGLSIRNGFQQLQVELGGFYDHFADGQDTTDAPDGSDMLLDFDLHRRRQPSLVLAADSVIEARLAIPGLAVSPGSAELSTGG